MSVSRSEQHKKEKARRKKRFRRLLAVNLTMLGLIAVLAAVWLTAKNDHAATNETANSPSSSPAETANDPSAEQPSGDAGTGGTPAGQGDNQGEGQGDGQGSAQTAEPPADTGDADGSSPPAGEGSSGSGDAGASSPPAGTDNSGSGEAVRLAFVGDILLGASVADMLNQHGYDYPYKGSKLYLSDPDITAGNLEYPVTERGVPAEDKQFVFKGPPDALPALRDSGIDVLSLANNHTLDQGVDGLLDTMKHLDDTGLTHMGAGRNDTEAFAPAIVESEGVKVAYIGLSRVVPDVSWKADKNVAGVAETYDTTRAVAAIKKAKQQADLVVVMVHWGEERKDKPLDYQRDFARQYIDAGADLIVGSHPHVLQGFESYKGKWIAYSLGNFIFSVYPKGKTGETGVLEAECTKSGSCELQFYPMSGDKAQPKPMEQKAGAALLSRMTSISYGAEVRKDGRIVAK